MENENNNEINSENENVNVNANEIEHETLCKEDSAEKKSPSDRLQETPKFRKGNGVSIPTFISVICAVLILAILCTFTVTSQVYDRIITDLEGQSIVPKPTGSEDKTQSQLTDHLEIFSEIFKYYSVYDLDEDAMTSAILKAYCEATGDVYSNYYTAEEFAELTADTQGDMQGIGVSVVNTTATVNGFEYRVLQIISVFENSPALKAGLRIGDQIYAVVDADGNTVTVNEIGYDAAITCVRGPSGTEAKLSVLRQKSKTEYDLLDFAIIRAAFTSESVTYRVFENDPTIGIVKITQFDLTTPPQFKNAMDSLIAGGCTKFVFDVRYNPGGDLQSIEAVLSTFLNEGDVMITTVYHDESRESDTVQVNKHTGSYATCDVTKEDIGKYRDYTYAVLINGSTASAAELFTSNLRDYHLATLVGTTTYGKGCMQTIMPLSRFGIEGAIKMTSAWYLPPCGESYHGIGISPSEENTVELDESLIEKYNNIYLIPDTEDNQLMHAIGILQNKQ